MESIIQKEEFDFDFYYDLLSKYKIAHDNTNVPASFKTLDGINYNRDGYKLGKFASRMRIQNKNGILDLIYKEKLYALGFRFENIDRMDNWMTYFNLAKEYYKHKGDLEASVKFTTFDGYTYNENRKKLGAWISRQKRA